MSKADSIITGLNGMFAERDGEITCLLLAALSGENVVLIGQEAAEDDSVVAAVNECIDVSELGMYMLSSTTAPEEISKLGSKAGFTVLNEVFNAPSSVMNSVLGMMKEGPKNINVICGTSRKVPNEDDEMFSLYSAFLFREAVVPVRDGGSFLNKISKGNEGDKIGKMSKSDIEKIRKEASGLDVDDAVLSAVLSIKDALDKDGKFISDARWKRAMDSLKVAAAAVGKKSVDASMVPLLQYVLWDRPEERKGIRRTIFEMCTPKSVDVADLRKESEELLKQVVESKGAIDENAGFPRVVYCYDCDESFVNLRRLKGHSAAHPRHTFADPNEAEGKEHSYKRYNYSDLVTLFTTKYKWEIFKDSDPEVKAGFLKEATELRKRMTEFQNGFEKDRSELIKGMEGNAWLSEADKEDLTEAFDQRSKVLKDIESVISDAETMLE